MCCILRCHSSVVHYVAILLLYIKLSFFCCTLRCHSSVVQYVVNTLFCCCILRCNSFVVYYVVIFLLYITLSFFCCILRCHSSVVYYAVILLCHTTPNVSCDAKVLSCYFIRSSDLIAFENETLLFIVPKSVGMHKKLISCVS